jgi:hypothetical protein
MRHGKSYFRIDARPHIYIGKDQRKATIAKHKELTSRRFVSRDEAEAAKPNDDFLTVVEVTPVHGII